MIIDYEACSYNYRGFDLANFFKSRRYDYSNIEERGFESGHKYPDSQRRLIVVREYLKELKRINPNFDEEVDNEENLMKEIDESVEITDLLVGGFFIICAQKVSHWVSLSTFILNE